jgi:hypothetical protein
MGSVFEQSAALFIEIGLRRVCCPIPPVLEQI